MSNKSIDKLALSINITGIIIIITMLYKMIEFH